MASTAITGRLRPGPRAGAEPGAEPGAGPGAEPGAEADAKPGAKPDAEPGTAPGSRRPSRTASPSLGAGRRSWPSGPVLSGSPGCAAADGASCVACPSPHVTSSACLVAPLWP